MAEKEEKQEVELEPVGPGADESGEIFRDTEGEPVEARQEERDERREETDEEEGDERAGAREEDEGEDRERIRERRRAERRKKREENHRNVRELNFLRKRNEDLERRQSEIDMRMSNTEVVTIDSRIAQVEADIRKADEVYATAINKGDGNAASEAQRIRDTLRDGLTGMQRQKQSIINGARQRANAPAPDPEIARRAQDWVSSHSWYDPNLGDEDSMIARTIDVALSKELGVGAARGDAYWEEYDRRLRKRLPHLFSKKRGRRDEEDDEDDFDEDDDRSDDRDIDEHNRRNRDSRRARDDDDDRSGRREDEDGRDDRPRKRNGGPRFVSGGRERPLKKNEVYVSAERRKALEEAGVWDDPKIRNRYLKRYQDYDAAARRNRR